MILAPERSVLDSRVTVISGKGGTGKSSVAAALALAARREGHRVVVAEVSQCERISQMLKPKSSPAGYPGREVVPGITVVRIDPYAALSEYLGLRFGFSRAISSVLSSKSLRQLMDGSPGWRELIALGKIWHLEQLTDERGQPTFDRIVVDAPASGHGVTFLDIPRVVASAIRGGPLRREARRVQALIHDPMRTVLLPVSLPEELPVQETVELVSRIREQVGIHVDHVVANGVSRELLSGEMEPLSDRLDALAPGSLPETLPEPGVLAHCVRYVRSRATLHRHFVSELASRTELPVLLLPFLEEGLDEPADLERLSAALSAPEWFGDERP